ncbi:MAG: FAD-binding protein [Flavobacteriia bacterium]|nr:FAD-binding protein [Flavobacteriia bacterium]
MKANGLIADLLNYFNGGNVEITFPELADYNLKIQVSNTLKKSYPLAIVYCENAEHIKRCLSFSKLYKLAFRIRSGGHNHEGYCSANNTLVIDISKINEVKIFNDKDFRFEKQQDKWPGINGLGVIGAGSKFGALYNQLIKEGYIIAGGGCESVSIGGFAQGGGWGPYSRFLGMGCDNILGVQIVLPDGEEKIYFDQAFENLNAQLIQKLKLGENAKIDYCKGKDNILYAIRGGGGGNFGVIVNFFYRIHQVHDKITEFSLSYHANRAEEVTRKWLAMITYPDARQTSACRIAVSDKADTDSAGIIIVGKYLGNNQELIVFLNRFGLLEKGCRYKYVETTPLPLEKTDQGVLKRKSVLSDQYEGENFLIPDQLQLLDTHIYSAVNKESIHAKSSKKVENNFMLPIPNYPNAPGSTCDRPHPHKVTSFYPKKDQSTGLIHRIIEIVQKEKYDNRINKYVSLHGMGGNIGKLKIDSAMPYKDKDFIVQLQAWWDFDFDNQFNTESVNWVHETRNKLKDIIEGAFINFIDKDIIADYNASEEKRKELLNIYYGNNLDELIKLKKIVDVNNRFNFEMSVPVK